MILRDEQTGERYEVDQIKEVFGVDTKECGAYYLKPLDTKEEWPSYEDDYYFISTTGNVHCAAWGDTPDDRKLYECGNCYRTKEEAEQARDRIASIKDCEVTSSEMLKSVVENEDGTTNKMAYVCMLIDPKYLKAWEAKE